MEMTKQAGKFAGQAAQLQRNQEANAQPNTQA